MAWTRWKTATPRCFWCPTNGIRGNPCLFPARFFPELRALQGDCGGSAVIRRHEDALLLYEVPAGQLTDVDTRDALTALTERQL